MISSGNPETTGKTTAEGADMNENPQASERVHSEAPAEGDENADPRDIRVHSQDPAEGREDTVGDVPGGADTGAEVKGASAGG